MNEEEDESREVEMEMKQRNKNRGRENAQWFCVHCFCSIFKLILLLVSRRYIYVLCMRCGQRNL